MFIFLRHVLRLVSLLLCYVVTVTYIVSTYKFIYQEPEEILTCIDSEHSFFSWTCQKALQIHLSGPKNVELLNHRAGVGFAVYLRHPGAARYALKLFLKAGVRIDAPDDKARHMTALHTTVRDGDLDKTRMLLDFGAAIDVKNDDGETALTMAESLSQAEPNNPNRGLIVKLLQAKYQRTI